MVAQIDSLRLLRSAWVARETAYAPYSEFAVGAALLTEAGQIFTGCNMENVSLGLTICAERVALTTAVQAGERRFVALALAAETTVAVVPSVLAVNLWQNLTPFYPFLVRKVIARIFRSGR